MTPYAGDDVREFGIWVPKGWGGEHVIVNDEENNYCAKRLFVAAGRRFSYHYHEIKHETFYVVAGEGDLWTQPLAKQEEFPLAPRDRTILEPGVIKVIPQTLIHQVIAKTDLWIFETSTFHRDEDSVRIEKGD